MYSQVIRGLLTACNYMYMTELALLPSILYTTTSTLLLICYIINTKGMNDDDEAKVNRNLAQADLVKCSDSQGM